MPKLQLRTEPAPRWATHSQPLPGHTLELRIGPAGMGGAAVIARVECYAGPDALCWKRGPDGGGPAWMNGPLPPHLLSDGDTCAVTERLNGTEGLYWYDGPTVDLRPGPIDVVYRPGYAYTWSYPQDEAQE